MGENVKRKRNLPNNWYPDNPDDIYDFISNSIQKTKSKGNYAVAAVVPHAGWYFSGSIAVNTIADLKKNPDIVIITGGHLGPGSGIYYAPEKVFETPLGDIVSEQNILKKLKEKFRLQEDLSTDNTVEIHTPIIKYFFPESTLLWLRVGSGQESIELGKALYNIINKTSIETVVIGSTDLTHYGSNFSFQPMGEGIEAVEWVKNVNDKKIVDQMIEMDCKKVLKSANNNFAACSAGGAVSAIEFAKLSGVKTGKLIEYASSYDTVKSESFVGYAGIVF
jgi:MEMO1 family protein